MALSEYTKVTQPLIMEWQQVNLLHHNQSHRKKLNQGALQLLTDDRFGIWLISADRSSAPLKNQMSDNGASAINLLSYETLVHAVAGAVVRTSQRSLPMHEQSFNNKDNAKTFE